MLLEEERPALRALPPQRFEARRVENGQADSLSLVRLDRNSYSVPTAYAHQDVTVVGGIEEVTSSWSGCRSRTSARIARWREGRHEEDRDQEQDPAAPFRP